MKNLITLIITIIFSSQIFAQAPQKMSYQAVIRNSSNNLVVSKSIGMQISILQGTATGTAVYVERQTPTTNNNGLATVEIGTGTIVSGTFSTINWANGPYFIKTETDINGGSIYTISGTSQLMSVPYALFAANSTPGPQGIQGIKGDTGARGLQGDTSWLLSGTVISNRNQGNVGIGTSIPQAKLSVGSSSTFQVDSVGNIKKINNIPTSFPATQGSNGQVLTNNGSGNLNWSNVIPYVIASGTNSITFNLTPAITSYTAGNIINFKAIANNTGNVTISINGLTAKNLFKNANSNLSINDIKNGQIVSIIYDGTNFQLLNQQNQSGTFNGSNAQTLIYLGDGF